ncbi:hypothetical protein B0H13DRAFT_2284474 [Mycena leptocephala]|nr:hypothetical protein B0H13DRAFT_2284474 [Mycena leptocephala]
MGFSGSFMKNRTPVMSVRNCAKPRTEGNIKRTAVVAPVDLPAAHPDMHLPHIALPVFPAPPLVVIGMPDFPSHLRQEIGAGDAPSAIQRDIGVVDARNVVARPRAFFCVWVHAADVEKLVPGGDVAGIPMRLPFPDGCDEFLRSSSDGSTNHESAYERARAHAVILGNTRVAWLWRHALEIGLRTGLGRSILQKSTDAFLLGHESGFKEGREAGLKEGRTGGLRDGKQDGRKAGKIQGLKEGEAIGFTKGQEDGLKEGKRQGFVAGREFGEKQALKLSKTSAPERVFVDVGTDSPVAELVPPPPPSSAPIHVPLPPATPHCTVTHSTPLRPPPNWSDLRLYAPNSTNSLPLPASLSSEIPVAIPQSPAVPFDWADDAKSLAIPLPLATCLYYARLRHHLRRLEHFNIAHIVRKNHVELTALLPLQLQLDDIPTASDLVVHFPRRRPLHTPSFPFWIGIMMPDFPG